MKIRIVQTALAFLTLLLVAGEATSHCEIPCGIYDDAMRIKMMAEHIATIEKSMNMIKDLDQVEQKNTNQQVRWVMNKEDHANQLQEIVSQYFLTQRIKPDQKNYQEMLTQLHQMLIAAMKAKQTVDLANVTELNRLLKEFEKLYFAMHS